MTEAATPHIHGYDDLVEIGRGGFATVFRARQIRLRRLVAVKVLHAGAAGPAAIARFEHECEAVGALSGHPNVVAVHDAGTTEDGRPYLAMEYLPRGSLANRLTEGPLPASEVLDIGARLADALAAAHDADVLHRDVKPENVLIGPTGTPKLADFGIAVVADAHQTATGVVIGTVLHSAPEVLTGSRATVAADVYSLASTMYALINGTAAFAGSDDEGLAPTMFRVVNAPVPDLRRMGIASAAAELLETGMAKQPEDRFPSASAFQSAITATSDVMVRGTTVIMPSIASTPPPPISANVLERTQVDAPAWRPDEPPTLPPAPAVVTTSPPPATPPPPQATPVPAPVPHGPDRDHPPHGRAPSGRRGLIIGLVIALVLVTAAAAGGVIVYRDEIFGTDPTTTSASTTESTSSSSISDSSTSTSTTTSTTTTTTSTTTTTTLPPANTITDAIARVEERYPEFTITDESGFRIGGPSVLIGQTVEGRFSAFLFGDGQLLGRDAEKTSARVIVVDLGGNDVVLGYDIHAAGEVPPSEPIGRIDVTLRWDGDEGFTPIHGDFPPTDTDVEGHR